MQSSQFINLVLRSGQLPGKKNDFAVDVGYDIQGIIMKEKKCEKGFFYNTQ